jgi:divalent metal cation (Fe/Co/Zn/Cd) transporter
MRGKWPSRWLWAELPAQRSFRVITTKNEKTRLGIAILLVAALFMPWLAKKKRSLAAITGNRALTADATESAMCGYLSLIALAGLVFNAIWRISWADPVAAVCLLPFILKEGWEAVQGKHDCC